MDAGTALEAIEYGPFLDGACVVLAHSEPRRSNLAAPIDQSHPKLCCLFAQVSLVLLLVCAAVYIPSFGPPNIRKSIIRHAHPAQNCRKHSCMHTGSHNSSPSFHSCVCR
jgi:hypothetical protein